MSKFKSDKVLPRYLAIAVLLTLIGVGVIFKAGYTMTAKKSYWETVANRQKSDSDSVRPNRGNILSCDGQLLASSIPEYKIFMDYQAGGNADTAWIRKRDSIWDANIDTLSICLNSIFPERSAEEFKARLEEGRHKELKNGSVGARHWAIWPKRLSYNTYCEVQQLPYFNLPANKGGFHAEKFEARRRPFGSLAERTIGDIRSFEGGKDTARFGIELSYDSLLRGKYGYERKQKVLNKIIPFTVTPPINGCDIVTTIDVGMQDLAEQALVEGLKKWNASMGVTILMEVKTGDVKAIVNMRRSDNGNYYERFNDAISYRCEPGSVFKVASFLVALDDGVVDTSYVIHTGSGIMPMHGAKMKDHNWHRGGYGDINVARTLEVSSNIGVSCVIDKFYEAYELDDRDMYCLVDFYGREPLVIELAKRAKAKGQKVVGVVNKKSYDKYDGMLLDYCDAWLDMSADEPDTALEVDGVKIGQLSSTIANVIAQMLTAEIYKWFIDHGKEAPVLLSANIKGADVHNNALTDPYGRRIR